MIQRLLAANRGEIARRVIRTCRDLGIEPVAVYSDVDASAPHVAEADLAVRLPGAAPADTYLRGDLLIAAAHQAGADALHPGYGFLSENAEFAQAVLDAGLTWVGPPPKAIEAMGSKLEAKRLMAEIGVPALRALTPEALAAATEADLPLLIKATAAGGGRGMRIVRELADLPTQLDAARAEARHAFGAGSGDETVFCEPYLEAGRHIEVQILADCHGVVWTLGERDCSIQRRHQKLVEESPSPLVDRPEHARLREALRQAARAAATAVGYVGAGTVEFLVAPEGRADSVAESEGRADSGTGSGQNFWFLEMNTRLQVEHPVTECVTGVDLVAWQLRIAEGAPLDPEPPPATGHAIEARLYAETVSVEDGVSHWRPQVGTLRRFVIPGVDAEFKVPSTHGVRLDSGVVDGDVVSVHYDPLLAKVIAWAATRAEAVRRLAAALAGAQIHGVATNRDLLTRVLRHPAFGAGDTDTAFLDCHGLASLAEPLADAAAERLSALAAALADAAGNRANARVLGGLPNGWRNLPSAPQRKSYHGTSGQIDVEYRTGRDGELVAPGKSGDGVRLLAAQPGTVLLEVANVTRAFAVAAYAEGVHVDSALGSVWLLPVRRFPDPTAELASGSLLAPMPGTVTEVHVAVGDHVTAGTVLLTLEAMKMQHTVTAVASGVVASTPVSVGAVVDADAVLAVVTTEEG